MATNAKPKPKTLSKSLQKARGLEQKVKRDVEENLVFIDLDCFQNCWDPIQGWLTIDALIPTLMRHGIVNDDNDRHMLRKDLSPNERASNLLALAGNAGRYGYHLLYMSIRDCTPIRQGHVEAVEMLVGYAKKKNIPPPWEYPEESDEDTDGVTSELQCTPKMQASADTPSSYSHLLLQQKCPGLESLALSNQGGHPSATSPQLPFPVKGGNSDYSYNNNTGLQDHVVIHRCTETLIQRIAGNTQSMEPRDADSTPSSLPNDVETDSVRPKALPQSEPQRHSQPGETSTPQLEDLPGQLQGMIQRNAINEIAELINQYENPPEIEFATSDACKTKDDFIASLCKFIVAYLNSRDTAPLGIFIGPVDEQSEESLLKPGNLTWNTSLVSENLVQQLTGKIYVKNLTTKCEARAEAEEVKQMVKLEFLSMPQSSCSSAAGGESTLALVIVSPDRSVCKNHLFTYRLMPTKPGQVLKRVDGGCLHVSRPNKMRGLQKALDDHYNETA